MLVIYPLTIAYEAETALYHVMTFDNDAIYSNWSLESCKAFCRKLRRSFTLDV